MFSEQAYALGIARLDITVSVANTPQITLFDKMGAVGSGHFGYGNY